MQCRLVAMRPQNVLSVLHFGMIGDRFEIILVVK